MLATLGLRASLASGGVFGSYLEFLLPEPPSSRDLVYRIGREATPIGHVKSVVRDGGKSSKPFGNVRLKPMSYGDLGQKLSHWPSPLIVKMFDLPAVLRIGGNGRASPTKRRRLDAEDVATDNWEKCG